MFEIFRAAKILHAIDTYMRENHPHTKGRDVGDRVVKTLAFLEFKLNMAESEVKRLKLKYGESPRPKTPPLRSAPFKSTSVQQQRRRDDFVDEALRIRQPYNEPWYPSVDRAAPAPETASSSESSSSDSSSSND